MRLAIVIIISLIFSVSISAAEVVVNWQNPKSYTDVKSANENQKRFRQQVTNQLTKHWLSFAKQLPQGSKLEVTMTNLNLAGEVRYNFAMHREIRIVSDRYWPMMNFDYKLTNGDKVLLEGSEKLKDMNFMLRANSIRSSRESRYYEKRIISDWFVDRLQVMIAKLQKTSEVVMA